MINLEQKEFKNIDRLIDTAIREFSSHSYEEASLNRIIKEAEVSKGSFYFHFKDKKDLYIYIFKIVALKKIEFIGSHKKRIAEKMAASDIFGVLKEYAKVGFEFMKEYPEYHKLGSMFFREKGNAIYEEVKQLFTGESDNIIRPLIDRAVEKNEIRKDLSRDFIVKVLNGLIDNFDDIFELDYKNIDIEKTVELYSDYIDFIKNGLSAKKE